jgi:multidrug efflux pump subunit AcrA (membrane-fusion protein)
LKKPAPLILIVVVVIGACLGFYFLAGRTDPPKLALAKAARHEIRVVVSTNGLTEPEDLTQVYAPIDGFVTAIQKREGAEILQGHLLLQLNSDQLRVSLAEASASLLSAKKEARALEVGPSREEISAIDASIAETEMQLKQVEKDLATEQSLLAKHATSGSAVDKIRN